MESNIEVSATQAKSEIDKLISSIDELKDSIDKTINSSQTNKLKQNAQETAKIYKSLSTSTKLFNFNSIMSAGRKVVDIFKEAAEESIGYIENLNLFEVSMGNMTEKATEFQETMHEAFGTNISEMMKYQGLFNQMSKSMGITNDASYLLSENFTKLGYDLSSLFNISTSSAMEKLRAGLAGQTKPLRDLGLDITQQSLTPIVEELGIDRSVKQMSQAEKMVLRYIAVLRQAGAAQGDFARTTETPANQLKILSAQFQELKRSIGNLFFNMLGRVLPYVNAVVMVLRDIFNAIAKLFGFTIPNLNSELRTADLGADIGADDLEDDLNGASGAAQKLKNILFGFDEINNIELPTASSGGNGGISGGVGGIDSRLLDAMKEYDNLMENVNLKANEIKKKMLDWLGLTEAIETGNWDIKKIWENMHPVAKTILGIIATIAGYKILKWIATLIQNIGTIGSAFSTVKNLVLGSKIGQAIASFIGNPLADLKFAIEAVSGGAATLSEGILFALGSLGSFVLSLGAIVVGVVLPIVTVINAIKEMQKGIVDLTGVTDLFSDTISFKIGILPFAFKKVDDSISETTKNAVQPFIDNLNNLGSTIWDLNLGDVVTKEDVDNVKTQTSELTNTLQTNLIDKTDAMKQQLNDVELFPDVNKREEYLAALDQSLNEEKEMLKYYEDEINKIVENAANENRNLTDTERVQINELQRQMGEEGINILSQNEQEALTLKARFNYRYDTLTAEQLMNTVKQAKELKDKTIEEAQEEYDKKVSLAEQMRATLPTFTEEMYNQMIDDAKTNKDETIKKAEEAYQGIVDNVNEKYPEISKTINFETGEQKKGLELAGTWISEKYTEIKEDIKTKVEEISNKWKAFTEALPQFVEDKKKELKQKFTDIKNDIVGKFTDIKDGIKNKINEALDWLKNNFKLPELQIPKLPKIGLSVSFIDDGGLISKAAKVLGLDGKPKFDFYTYASGGLPDIGQMFIAREAGPELVGQIGKKNAVVNNAQIVESISSAVSNSMYSAIRSAMSNSSSDTGSMKIIGKWNGKSILDIVIDGVNEKTRQNGEFVFDIPM